MTKTFHSVAGPKVYSSWYSIIQRCTDENHPRYTQYGRIGIIVEQEFIDNPFSFLEEIGFPPENSRKWSVDRIDNNLGYIKGNLRWATSSEQTKNRGMLVSNKTGVTGVRELTNKTGGLVYAANWIDFKTGKQQSKYYSVSKYGILEAFEKAISTRKANMVWNITQGAEYTKAHGHPKGVNNVK